VAAVGAVAGRPLLARSLASGTDPFILAPGAPLREATGANIGAISVSQDISVLRDLEQQRDRMLATVAHDLRNPITSISGMSQILQVRLG